MDYQVDLVGAQLDEIMKRQDSFIDALNGRDLFGMMEAFTEEQCSSIALLSDFVDDPEGKASIALMAAMACARTRDAIARCKANLNRPE